MKARTVKYYVLLWTLIILIGAYIGVTVLSTTSTSASDSITSDPVIDDIPTIPDNPSEDDPNGDVAEIPYDAIDLVNYAINIYNTGKGSRSSIVYEIQNTTPDFLGASVTQYAVGNILKNQTENLEECYFYYGAVTGGDTVANLLLDNNLLKVGYRAFNVDEVKDEVILVETPEADFNSKTYNTAKGTKKTFTQEQAVEDYVAIYSMDFPLEISNRTCSVKKYDTRSNKTYNIITLSYNINKLPEEMNRYYKANSALGKVEYSSYELTFVINKKTGKLAKYVRNEKFVSYAYPPAPLKTITINSNATFTQTFTDMDKEVEVYKPYQKFN